MVREPCARLSLMQAARTAYTMTHFGVEAVLDGKSQGGALSPEPHEGRFDRDHEHGVHDAGQHQRPAQCRDLGHAGLVDRCRGHGTCARRPTVVGEGKPRAECYIATGEAIPDRSGFRSRTFVVGRTAGRICAIPPRQQRWIVATCTEPAPIDQRVVGEGKPKAECCNSTEEAIPDRSGFRSRTPVGARTCCHICAVPPRLQRWTLDARTGPCADRPTCRGEREAQSGVLQLHPRGHSRPVGFPFPRACGRSHRGVYLRRPSTPATLDSECTA